MKKNLRLAGGLAVLALLTTLDGNAQDSRRDPRNFYPLQVGNAWHFKVTVAGNVANAVSRITKIENLGGVALARLEATVNDKVVAHEHLLQNMDGVFRYRNNGMEISPPLCLLKYPVKVGAKWEGEINVGLEKGKYVCETSEENVEVPFGKFKAVKVAIRLDSMGQIVTTSYWFVGDIGFVKQTVDAGGLSILMELEKFEKGK